MGPSLISRVRALLERAAAGPLDPAELVQFAPLLEDLRARIERLRALGADVAISEELEVLASRIVPAVVAA